MARKIKTEKRKLDKLFSEYIRTRDSDGYLQDNEGMSVLAANCITCDTRKPITQLHAGHFVKRGKTATRWDERNVNAQCAGCNTFREGEQYKHGRAIDEKWGEGTADELTELGDSKVVKLNLTLIDELRDKYKDKLNKLRG